VTDPVRILVVDDEPANVDALCATLAAKGYAMRGCTNAADALEALARDRYALLLADLNMPDMSGLELLQAAQEREPDLVGVIMTGEGTIASAVEAMKTGALDYVLKPLKLATLLPVISRALTIRRLRLDNAALERGLRERTRELEDALLEVDRQTAERLKAEQDLVQVQKIEAIGRLTGGIAHDFNNLLTAVIGNLEMVKRKVDPQMPYRRFVDNALDAAKRGSRVTDQLLAFSRTQRLALQPVAVDETLERADTLLRHALGPNVRLVVALAARGAWANTDPTQLELAVLNLIVNARDAMPDGGDIRLQTAIKGQQIVVEVADTGTGMEPDVLARAMEPFFTTKGAAGSGLGLAQVYGFARQSGGDVTIDSTPGAGSRVRIILPRVTEPRAEVPTPPVEPTFSAMARPFVVLVVDDDDQVRRTLCDGLESEGFVVMPASDGPSGLELLASKQPDAAVLDYAMPIMTGAEVARRARAKYPALPIIFCSGYADSLALDQIEAATVVRKPVSIVDLSRMITGAILAP
jgi:signal transduction histidine kinase